MNDVKKFNNHIFWPHSIHILEKTWKQIPYFLIQFPRKLFFFEFNLMYCDLWQQYIQVRKLFKGGNYSRKYGSCTKRDSSPQLQDFYTMTLVTDLILTYQNNAQFLGICRQGLHMALPLSKYGVKDFLKKHSNIHICLFLTWDGLVLMKINKKSSNLENTRASSTIEIHLIVKSML